MKKNNLNNMVKGWFVGNFEPSLLKTNDVEVGIKEYKKGDYEVSHHHKIATEITVIISGKVKMNHQIYNKGDIIVIEPNESTDFLALEDVITSVVKIPGANNDKYID
jgi:quercetin dioxygenase-like cupin family protein